MIAGLTHYQKMKKKGLMISFEGLSCAGKSTELARLAEKLQQDGNEVVVVQWNSLKPIRFLTKVLRKAKILSPLIYSLLQWKSFLFIYYFKISPSLRKGKIVLTDRYVYTAYTRDFINGVNMKLIKRLYSFAESPDLTLFFNILPDVCSQRVESYGKQIFHLCYRILQSERIDDRCQRYFNELYNHYHTIFSDRTILRGTEVLLIGGEWHGVSKKAEEFLQTRVPVIYLEELNDRVKKYSCSHTEVDP